MKVALSIEITDEQRNALASAITGKETKRLATRDEVREFLEGAIASLGASAVVGDAAGFARTTVLSPAEEELVGKLRAEGRSSGYIVGYIKAGRK